METLGWIVTFVGVALTALMLWRGSYTHIIGRFPLFYSYIAYALCGTVAMFIVFRFRHDSYPYAYWLYFLLTIIVEFAVLVEISDHLFEPFPAIRQLGRALTIIISFGFSLVYILPTLLDSHGRHSALLGFALRASLTKAVILGALLLAAHHYGLNLGRNVAGLIMGFSIYLGVNITNFAADQLFYHIYDKVLWMMSPLAFTLCLSVWLIALWDYVPAAKGSTMSPAAGRGSEGVALKLTRFNNEMSKFLEK